MQVDLLLDSFLWSEKPRSDLESLMQSALRGEKSHSRDILSLIFARMSLSYAQKSARFGLDKGPVVASSASNQSKPILPCENAPPVTDDSHNIISEESIVTKLEPPADIDEEWGRPVKKGKLKKKLAASRKAVVEEEERSR